MIKNIVGIILLSIIIILTMHQIQPLLAALISAHNWIAEMLKEVFSGGQVGNVTRQLLALLTLPVLVGLIPAIIYWLAKRGWFPYFMEVVWIVWLVQTTALIVKYKPLVI